MSALFVQRGDASEFRKRFRWIALGMAVLFLALGARLFQLQVIEGDDHRAIARENIVRKITLATTRGIIRDRNGKVLAASRPSYNLFVVPGRLDLEKVWPKLVDYLGLGLDEQKRLEERITKEKDNEAHKRQQILLKEDISRDAVANLTTHEAELSAVEVVPVPVRYYPSAEVGAHVLGYTAELDSEKLAQLRASGYVEGDRLGATGVERAWESYLRGTRGWEKVLVDAKGRRRQGGEGIIEEPLRSDPIPGRDLRLTIDADIEKAMDKAFRGEVAGGAVLVDVRTGRLLGLYSKPAFDPNVLAGGSGKKVMQDAFKRMADDEQQHPLLDKTMSGAYPPGSTFKPFTALAALEKGLIDKRVTLQCRGFINFGKRFFRCTHVHGLVDLHKAIAESCNIYFWSLARDYGVGMDHIADMAQRFGLGQKTGLGVNAEASGRMPTKAWMTLRNKGHFQEGFTLNAAIGQGATTVTLLQLALAYAALANGGTLYQPGLVRAVETSNGTVVQEFNPRVRRQIELSPQNLALVQDALNSGVNEVGGTAYRARQGFGEVVMAGKTGTAQVSHHVSRGAEERVWYFNREHAWFAGYAPARAPEVAIVVLVEHGGAGGKHAAPIAFEVVRAFQEIQREKREGQRAAGSSPGNARAKASGPAPAGAVPR